LVCQNCSSESEGKFCPACGQRIDVKRITFREGWFDFWARIYGFDSMFPRTMRDLTLRPGVAAKRYIQGNRAMYYGPVGYYFLMITLMLLAASLLGIDFNEAMLGRTRDLGTGVPEGSPLSERQLEFQLLVLNNFRIFSFLLVFFYTLWLRVFYRKSGYNILEHSVMPFFTMGHLYWLTIFDFILMAAFGKGLHMGFSMAISLLYFAYGAMTLYDYQSRVKVVLKAILAYVMGLMTFAVFIAVFTVIFILLRR
jgi:hypothetical protein